jgi:ACR3 family arsenite efflux pump ArsB
MNDNMESANKVAILSSLSLLDRFLAPIILIAMILGVIIGVYADGVEEAFNGARFAGVSVREFTYATRLWALAEQL